LIGDQEPEAISMNRDPAGSILRICAYRDKVPGSKFHKQSFFDETIQRILERTAILSVKAELAHELLVSSTGMGQFANVLKQARVCELPLHIAMVSAPLSFQ
jgi:hypothetical protein